MTTVLLIDDDPLELQVREAVLRAAGLAPATAASAEEALALLADPARARQLRLIITDHVMPEGSGADFVRALRRLKPEVPVMVLSGLPEAAQDYEGLGVTFRQKPCPPEELIALCRAALGRS